MNDLPLDVSLKPPARIGLRGLPQTSSNMVPGGLYVLVAETPAARFPVLASSLSCALKDGRRCAVIVAGNPDNFVQRLESLGGIPSAERFQNKQLQMFVTQEEFSKKMFRFGTESFVQELEHFEIPENSFLVFDQADDLVTLHDISLAREQFEVLGQWFMRRQISALLVFLRITESDGATLNALMDSMNGIARLGGDEEGLRLSFDYWQSPEGTVAARIFQLSTLPSGQYEASLRISGAATSSAMQTEAEQPEPEASERRYFYMDPDLGSMSTQVAGVWQHVDTLVGMMHATRNQRSATVIFCYGQDMNLRQLAEAVHTLRIHLGKYAQLIVQEKQASLRYQNEALLLRLGVNMVIHRDVAPARLPLLLDSVTGQVFSREIDVDFEAALASVMPTQVRGYIPPVQFVREVELLLERSSTLNIPFALAIARPVPEVAMIDVLGALRMSRPGDLVTADQDLCYVFLNACQQAVILTTMERLLGEPLNVVFEDIRFQVSREDIGHDLAALLHNTKNSVGLDYTAALNATAPAQESAVLPSVRASEQVPAVAFLPETEVRIQQRPVFEQDVVTEPKQVLAAPARPVSLYGAIGPAVFGKSEAPRAKRSISLPTP